MPVEKIPLFDVISYEVEYEIRATACYPKEISYCMTFYFTSYIGAGMFHHQFDERFVPQDKKDADFKYQPIFYIINPTKQKVAKDKVLWSVACFCILNSENQYGRIIQDNTIIFPDSDNKDFSEKYFSLIAQKEFENLHQRKQSIFNFAAYMNSYFAFPQADQIALARVPKRDFEIHIQRIIYFDKRSFKATESYLPRIRSLSPIPDSKTYSTEGRWEGNTFCAPELPFPQIPWPYTRRYKPDYVKLLTQQSEQTLARGKRINDFVKELPATAKIVEFGAGAGFGVSDIKKLLPKAKIIAVGITPLEPENASQCDEVYYCFIPSNLQLLKNHFGTADAVIDVFGVKTYAPNTVHAAIYGRGLLKVGGKFMGVISGLDDPPHTFDSSPLGAGINRHVLVKFFKEYLGVELTIKKTKVESKLKIGKIVEDFYVEFTVTEGAKSLTFKDFIRLCELADEIVGKPHEIDMSSQSDYGQFKSQAIKSMFFLPPPEKKTCRDRKSKRAGNVYFQLP